MPPVLQPILKNVSTVEHIGGSVFETLSCGHKIRWRNKHDWKDYEGHPRPCYRCFKEKHG